MLLSTLLTATLTATSAAAAAISIRDESPAGRSYTILGCIEYSDPEYGYKVNDAGSEQVTLEECLSKGRRGPPLLQVTWKGRSLDGTGLCQQFRNNGPNITDFRNYPTTQDGFCASDQGVTAISISTEESYVGCYDQMWWYKSHYRPGWGKFKPAKNPTPAVPYVINKDTVVQLDSGPNTPIHTCIRNCPPEWPAVALSPQGDCICTNAEVGKSAPGACTATSWRFYWNRASGNELPRAANNYRN